MPESIHDKHLHLLIQSLEAHLVGELLARSCSCPHIHRCWSPCCTVPPDPRAARRLLQPAGRGKTLQPPVALDTLACTCVACGTAGVPLNLRALTLLLRCWNLLGAMLPSPLDPLPSCCALQTATSLTHRAVPWPAGVPPPEQARTPPAHLLRAHLRAGRLTLAARRASARSLDQPRTRRSTRCRAFRGSCSSVGEGGSGRGRETGMDGCGWV